ncbi:MAG: hypothetical protein VB092_08110 [Oscillospiraceae bacterium]|nr:hypothetical protein [Oscillospiraceae bacterium]
MEPTILNTERKAEIFDELVRVFEEFYEDMDTYMLLRQLMSEQEIVASGVKFKYNERHDSKQEAADLREQLGGPADSDALPYPCKFKRFLKLPIRGPTFVEHSSNEMLPYHFGGIEPKSITPDKLTGWEDVLNADIVRVFAGAYGTHIEVDNVTPERLNDFCEAADFDELAKARTQYEGQSL